jgi:hypothetical protein
LQFSTSAIADRGRAFNHLSIEPASLRCSRQVNGLGLFDVCQATQFGNCNLVFGQLDAGVAVLS